MSQAVIVVDEKDNVATALGTLVEGESLLVDVGGMTVEVPVLGSIPFGHKIALRGIEHGEEIRKYGEVIGRATKRIKRGEHVHIHNIESLRGRGDLVDKGIT